VTVNNSARISLAKEREACHNHSVSLSLWCLPSSVGEALPTFRSLRAKGEARGGVSASASANLSLVCELELWPQLTGDRALGPPIGRQASWGEPEGVQGMARGGCAPSTCCTAAASRRQDSPPPSFRVVRRARASSLLASLPTRLFARRDSDHSDPHDPSCQECRNANVARRIPRCVSHCRAVGGAGRVGVGLGFACPLDSSVLLGCAVSFCQSQSQSQPSHASHLPTPAEHRGLIERALTRRAFTLDLHSIASIEIPDSRTTPALDTIYAISPSHSPPPIAYPAVLAGRGSSRPCSDPIDNTAVRPRYATWNAARGLAWNAHSSTAIPV
jgi:hypothetical protein